MVKSGCRCGELAFQEYVGREGTAEGPLSHPMKPGQLLQCLEALEWTWILLA